MFSKLKKLFKGVELPKHHAGPDGAAVDLASGNLSAGSGEPVASEGAGTAGALSEKPQAPRCKTELKRNRKGIRVIGKHQDVADYFAEDPSVENIYPPEKPGDHERVTIRDIPAKASADPKKVRRQRITRNGLPILDGQDDFSLFMERDGASSDRRNPSADQAVPARATGKEAEVFPNKNKHGIPFLSQEEEGKWAGKGPDSEKGEFLHLLNASLGQKTRDVMMREKGVKTSRNKPLTLKQKLKRYPMPQGQLDLHGYTAIRAEFRAETYLKNASMSKLHTVMIIVGKGLHSDEGAVLPDVIENLLNRMRKDGLVLAYEWENETKSRSGAVTVYLNNLAFD